MRRHRHKNRHRFGRRSVQALGIGLAVAVVAAVPAEAQAAPTPLGDYAEQIGTGERAYSYTRTTPFWSVVAVAPQPGANVDLYYLDSVDHGFGPYTSTAAGSAVDFVAVNTGRHPEGEQLDNVATVRPVPEGTQPQHIVELAQGRSELHPAPFGSPLMTQTVTMAANDVVRVWDTHLQVGEILNVAANGPGDVELFLVHSWASAPGAAEHIVVRSPGSAATPTPHTPTAHTDQRGAGGMEAILNYRAPIAGWYGVVMIKKRSLFSTGAGTYTIGRWHA